MTRILPKILAAAVFCTLSTGNAFAQDATGNITLELNRASATSDGGCQVVFFGQNGLDRGLSAVTWRLAVFDADGVFSTLLSLPLGALDAGKRRILQYNLPAACTDMSEIIVNDVAECTYADGAEASICLNQLTVSTRATIAFGL